MCVREQGERCTAAGGRIVEGSFGDGAVVAWGVSNLCNGGCVSRLGTARWVGICCHGASVAATELTLHAFGGVG